MKTDLLLKPYVGVGNAPCEHSQTRGRVWYIKEAAVKQAVRYKKDVKTLTNSAAEEFSQGESSLSKLAVNSLHCHASPAAAEINPQTF